MPRSLFAEPSPRRGRRQKSDDACGIPALTHPDQPVLKQFRALLTGIPVAAGIRQQWNGAAARTELLWRSCRSLLRATVHPEES